MMRTLTATSQRPPNLVMRRISVVTLTVLLVVFSSSLASSAQQAPVGLGTADSFAILAGSTITNTGPTTITGDVGLHPGSAVVGFPGNVTLHGDLYVEDAVAEQAKVDLATAYGDAAGRGPATPHAVELGGETLLGGVYSSGTFGITGTLTLDAEGNPDTVWVFQAGTTLITGSDSNVELINGADACNVYWQVGSSATLGTDSTFVGTILAQASITLNARASVAGRALAQVGAVTMDTNVITNAACTSNGNGDNGNGDNGNGDNGNGDNGNGDNGDNGNGDNGTGGNGDNGNGNDGGAGPPDGNGADGGNGGDGPPGSNEADGDNGDNGSDGDAPGGNGGDAPSNGDGTASEDGTDVGPDQIQTPTRINAGSGGAASSRQYDFFALLTIGVLFVILMVPRALRHRR